MRPSNKWGVIYNGHKLTAQRSERTTTLMKSARERDRERERERERVESERERIERKK